jgi:predicted phage replisome organizer
MFDNRKVRHLRRLPEGNNIVLIWVMLLTMAGRCNAGGMIFLTENIPYTPKMLADELDFEESTVRLALDALERLNMIVADEGFFAIAGWEEHQNTDGLERIRESKRIAQAKWREKKKELPAASHVDSTVDNERISVDATDKDKEEDIETLSKESVVPASGKAKKFIPPTVEEVREYCQGRGNLVDPNRFVDYYTANGWKVGRSAMKDWKAAVRTWEGNGSAAKKTAAKPEKKEIDPMTRRAVERMLARGAEREAGE